MSRGRKLLAVVVLVFGVGAARAEEKMPAPREAPATVPASEFAALADTPGCPHKPRPCVAGWVRRKAACGRHLCEWLTYRPAPRCAECACHKECSPCGVPRLYTFFLCNGDGSCGACPANGHLYGR